MKQAIKTDLEKGLRVGILDIESTDLNAEDGRMLCACIKEVKKDDLSGPVFTFAVREKDYSVEKGWNDKRAVKELIKEMDKFDLILTWYGSRFDIPFINTRALFHKIKTPDKNYRRDLCFVARGVGKLKSNRLATWGRFLFGKSGKSFLQWSLWQRAMRGHLPSLYYIITHCEKDVIETEKIYKRFMPLLGKLKRGG